MNGLQGSCSVTVFITFEYRDAHYGGCGGETRPQYFQSRSKIFLIDEKSVSDEAWILDSSIRVLVGPTSKCFRHRRSSPWIVRVQVGLTSKCFRHRRLGTMF